MQIMQSLWNLYRIYKKNRTQIVQSLWIGGSISTLEYTVILSHLRQNHQFHLYTYEKHLAPTHNVSCKKGKSYDRIKNLPAEVILKDAREIMPESEIFCYETGPGKGSFSAFSNIFRYKLLKEKGGWWIDMDVVANQTFDFEQQYVFASEQDRQFVSKPTTCVIKCPPNSPIMDYCYKKSSEIAKDRQKLKWGQIGPLLLGEAINYFNLQEYVKPHYTFCPIHWFQTDKIFKAHSGVDFSQSYGIHMWNEMWRRTHKDKNATFHPSSVYESLKIINKTSIRPINTKIIELNIINFCNLNCNNCCCCVTVAPSKEYMPISVVKKFTEESLDLKWKWHTIKLFGGEPTLHPQLFELLEILKVLKSPIEILTNGTNKHILSKLAPYIKIVDSHKEGQKLPRLESMYTAPIDLPQWKNAIYDVGCFRLHKCGIGLSCTGQYYACAPGIHVERIFKTKVGLNNLSEITETNLRSQLPHLCRFCGLFKQPKMWQTDQHISPSWDQAIKNYLQ